METGAAAVARNPTAAGLGMSILGGRGEEENGVTKGGGRFFCFAGEGDNATLVLGALFLIGKGVLPLEEGDVSLEEEGVAVCLLRNQLHLHKVFYYY